VNHSAISFDELMKHIAHRWLLTLITLLAFALRILRLDFQPLWWDEGYSVFFATRDFGTMIERTAIDIHPPLYYAILQLWLNLFGTSDVALRLLSVVIGTATIPLLYILARKLFTDHRIALVAAFLLAISPFHIYYSQEVRMYGLVTLLGLASIYLCVQLLAMTPGTRASASSAFFFILITTAALYTQYYAAFILSAEILLILAIYLAIDRRSSNGRPFTSLWANPLVHWLSAWLTIIILYLPWIVYAGPKLYAYVTSKVSIEKYAPLDPLTFLAQHLVAFAVGHLTAWTSLAWASIVLIGLVALAIVYDALRRNTRLTPYPLLSLSPTLLILLSLIVPLILGYLVNLVFPFHPIHSERLLLLAAPAFYLIAAIGIVMVWHQRARLGYIVLVIVTIICAASLYDFYTVPRYPKDDYRPLIADLQTMAQPNDILLAIYPWQIGYLQTYYHGASLNLIETPNDAWIKNPSQMQRDLETMLKPNARVWIPALQTQGRIIEDALDLYLRPRTYSVVDTWHGTTRLEMFARADDPPRAKRTLSFENEFSISDWGIATEPLIAGQDILRVWFDAHNVVPSTFKASVRLVDAKGNVWAQDDREMTNDLQRIGIFIPIGTPPGDYTVRLQIYRARDGKPLRDADELGMVRLVAPTLPNVAAIPNRMEINFENGMRLLGYTTSVAKPGVPAPITFFWQATRNLEKEYAVITQVQDWRGNVYATTQAAPAHNIYPTTHWQPNEIIRDPQAITLRGNPPDGEYRIVVDWFDPATNSRTPSHIVGSLTVKGRPHYFGAPTPANQFEARFGDVARLVGYEIIGNQRIVLYWRALTTSDISYKVFVHLVDANAIIRAQRDQIPGAGEYPTTSWIKDEYLVDVYDVDAPPGEYTIRIGMYDPATQMRLPAFDASNQPIGDYIELPTRLTR